MKIFTRSFKRCLILYIDFIGECVCVCVFTLEEFIVMLHLLQTMTTFMPPPPAATFLAFHPQDNNIIAIGMEDSTIQIYNVRVDEVLHCLIEPFNF